MTYAMLSVVVERVFFERGDGDGFGVVPPTAASSSLFFFPELFGFFEDFLLWNFFTLKTNVLFTD